MACRRQDIDAGIMVSFSYCMLTDECIQDAWNYINRPCATGWIRGMDLDLIEDCEAKENTEPGCQSFKSSPERATQYFNKTTKLNAQEYCKVKVEAFDEIARVIFDNAS